MSNDPYQNPSAPYAPPTTPIPVQQPSAPFAPAASGGQRRTGLLLAGVVVLIAGVVGGIVTYLASSSAYDEGVENLARAPVGCTTRLDFEETGTFTIYVETVGVTDDPGGDCPNSDEEYEREDEDLPDVEVVLVDDKDNEIDQSDEDGKSYDAGGAVGQSISTVEIDETGRYEMTVTSDEDDFAIAIGKNPKEAADSLKTIAYIVIAAGVVLGALLIILGLRKKSPPAAVVTTPQPVTHYPEAQPPTAYTPTGTHTPATSPPPFGGSGSGGFAPPSVGGPPTAPPASEPPPTRPMPAPNWPAPPNQ